ncbi:MAG: hypothetical protein JST92_06600 [Deltaproteobacteria bacterium]|nr:hypothetical protein [Deltaproteobacteria bacterium]
MPAPAPDPSPDYLHEAWGEVASFLRTWRSAFGRPVSFARAWVRGEAEAMNPLAFFGVCISISARAALQRPAAVAAWDKSHQAANISAFARFKAAIWGEKLDSAPRPAAAGTSTAPAGAKAAATSSTAAR